MKRDQRFVIALDIGTSALKVGLFDINGDLIQVETREQEFIFPKSDWFEQDPDVTWELIKDSIHTLVNAHGHQTIDAISVTVQRGSVIALDVNGKPLSNLVVWMDKRGREYAEHVNQLIGKERYYQTAGHSISYITGASKVLWFHSEGEEAWEECAVIGSPQTYFLKRLGSDNLVIDYSSGTYHFPMDIDIKEWSREIARELDFPLEKLPQIVSAVDVVGYLPQSVAQELRLKAGIPIIAGGGDGQCAAAGSGAIVPGICMINIGTGTGIQFYLEKPTRNPGMVFSCSGHVVPDAWESEGHTQASGAVFRWFRDEFGDKEYEGEDDRGFNELVDEAMLAPPTAEGLLFLPTFNGCTTPRQEPNARGCLLGLSLNHKKSHVIRAVLEGITLEIKWILESFKETGARVDEIRLVGGGSRNIHWNQIHADILDHPVSTVQYPDAAMVGCAMCAAVGLGEYPTLLEASKHFIRIKEEFIPQAKNKAIYQTLYTDYVNAFNQITQSSIFKDVEKRIGMS